MEGLERLKQAIIANENETIQGFIDKYPSEKDDLLHSLKLFVLEMNNASDIDEMVNVFDNRGWEMCDAYEHIIKASLKLIVD